MKKGINEESAIPAEWRKDRDAEFSKVKSAGFDGIELIWEAPYSEEDKKNIISAAEKYNLELISLVTPLFWEYPLTDASVADKAEETLRNFVSDAHDLGIKTVLCVPGVINGETDYLTALDNSRNIIKKNLGFLEEKDVILCIENVWNKFLPTPLEMRDFIDSFESEYVADYFDAGNVLVNAYPTDWVSVLGERIKRVHIKDFKKGIGNITGFTDMFQGDMNWPSLISSLRKVGYDGYITIEIPYYRAAPELFIKHESEKLDVILAM